MKKGDHKPPKDPDETGLEEESVSSSREAVPVPFLAGERKIAVTWITPVYKLYSRQADTGTSGGAKK